MLTSCKYCGGVHERGFVCPKKPIFRTRPKDDTKANKFRKSNAWKEKSLNIRKRDRQLCQVCLQNMHCTSFQYNYRSLSVHHIIPIHENYDLRLESENLITLCRYHHELAELGEIKRDFLQKLTKESEIKYDETISKSKIDLQTLD